MLECLLKCCCCCCASDVEENEERNIRDRSYLLPSTSATTSKSAASSSVKNKNPATKPELTEEEELQMAIELSQDVNNNAANPRTSLQPDFTEEEALELAIAISQMDQEEGPIKLRDHEWCIVCQSSERNYIFIDCRHIVCCEDCAKQFKISSGDPDEDEEPCTSCPVCRMPISRPPMRVFF